MGRFSKFASVTIQHDTCLFRNGDEGSWSKHSIFICPIEESHLSKTRTNCGLNALWACKPCFIAFKRALGKYDMLSVRNFG